MNSSTMCSRIWNATRVSARSLLRNYSSANIQIKSRICSVAKHGSLRPAMLSWLNTSNYNLGRPGFSSLTEAQVKDQYPPLGKLATLIESSDFQDAVAEFARTLDINIPNINDLMPAFIHKSYLIANHKRLQEQHDDNERLSVLGYQTTKQVITEYMILEHPSLSAQETWDVQNALLEDHVLKVAGDLELNRFMVFKNQPRPLMMCQSLFALVGAVYMHESPGRAAEFVKKRLIPELPTETVQHLVKLQHPKLLLKLFSEKQGTELPGTKIMEGRKRNSKSRFHLSQPSLYKVGVFKGDTCISKVGLSTSLDKAEKQACQQALLRHYREELDSFSLDLTADNFIAEDAINFGVTAAEQRVVEMYKEPGESFGFKIKGGLRRKGKNEEWLVQWYYSPVFISHIEPGGLADRFGGLKVGDVILAANDRKIEGLDHERAVKTLKSVSGEVTLTVRESQEVVLADAVETKYKRMKREKRLAELTSEVWGEWHQARATKNPSKYADVMEHTEIETGTNGMKETDVGTGTK